jgi:hypothetical protein
MDFWSRKSDRIQRAVAFYLSAALFLTLLPIVLSYSLGYHIDFKNLNVYKTGIIYVKSKPSDASIYINGRRYPASTPARLEELKPGRYNIEVRKEGFYPWQRELVVRPNMVTKADDIVLFPVTQEMKRLCEHEVMDFAVSGKGAIYYMTNTGLFKGPMDGLSMRRLSLHSNWPRDMIGKKFSPDGNKLLCYTRTGIWAVDLNPKRVLPRETEDSKVEEVLVSAEAILDVFWYSDSKHIVFVTEKDIKAAEINGAGDRNIVTLYKFNSRPRSLHYDEGDDSLYFIDFRSEKGPDAEGHIYRLELRQKLFGQLMERLRKEFDIRYEKREAL